MTVHPNIVASYERFDDKDSFQLITLDCTVPSSIDDKNSRKFSAVVTYMKRYTDKKSVLFFLKYRKGDVIQCEHSSPFCFVIRVPIDVGSRVAEDDLVLGSYCMKTVHSSIRTIRTFNYEQS